MRFLAKFERTVIFLVKAFMMLASFVAFYGLFSVVAPQLLRASRTTFITIFTYFLSVFLFLKIYGGIGIGEKKSKEIITGCVLTAFFTDVVTFLELIVMSQFVILMDFIILPLAALIQIVVIIISVYFGNWLFFKLHAPEKSILIYGEGVDPSSFLQKVRKYRKQWDVDFSLPYDTENIYKRLYPYKTVFLASLPAGTLSDMVEFCYKYGKNIYVVPRLSDVIMKNSKTVMVDDRPVYASCVSTLAFEQKFAKRAMDVFVSLIGTIVASPIIALCALAIKLDDHGPVFYRQKRVTENGRQFDVLKFRTMIVDAEKKSGIVWAAKNDDRITRVGKYLRKFRLDEIPQLLNILQGDMSLVGPRPEREELIREFEKQYPEFRYRLKVKAGLTGLAQISGKYNTTPLDKLMMDLEYIENYSVWLDLKLIFQTLKVLFKSDSTEGVDPSEKKTS